jgi:putative peptidoglycan lipid II flippase
MLGLGTLQLNTFLDMAVAMWPTWVGPMMFGREVTLDASSNAILRYTQTIYQFPLGVFGIAVATAVFPLLSRSANRPEEFASMLRRGLRLSFFIGLPASLGLWLVRYDLIHTMYAAGSSKFSLDGVDRAARVLAGVAPAIWAYSLNHVLTRAFYAKGDTSTPMRVSLVGVALNVALNFTLIWPMREAGLAWATAISATVQCLLLATLCGKRLGVSPVDRETGIAFMKVLAAAAIMGGAVFGLLQLWPEVQTWWARVLRLAATCIAGAGVFVGIARAMRLPEMRWITQRAPKGSGGAAAGMSFE